MMFDRFNCSVRDFGQELEFRVFDYGFSLSRSHRSAPDVSFGDLDDSPYWFYLCAVDLPDEVVEDPEERAARSLQVSLARTVQHVYYLARSYPWEWFVTFTFSPEVVDRYDYSAVSVLMSGYLKQLRRSCPEAFYMIVPELHKDGAFHFHGLFASCEPFLRLLEHGNGIFNVTSFKWGYTTATRVFDPIRCSRYVSKYITKDLMTVSAGKKRYWHSRNVKVPDLERAFLSSMERNIMLTKLQEVSVYSSEGETPTGDSVHYFTVKKDQIPPDVLRLFDIAAV